MGWIGVGQTDVGRHRKNNEDAFVADNDIRLFVVADGMGGQAAGEVASAQTVASVSEIVRTGITTIASRQDALALVGIAIEDANRDVHLRSKTEHGKAGMGCTLTMALVRDRYAIIGHVGDSRCYLLRNGVATALTADHTVVEEMRRAGDKVAEQVARGPFGNSLSRYIGMQIQVRADVFAVDLLPNDKLLLCSDGLSRYVPSEKWLSEQLQADALEAATEELVEFALMEGGRDNITVVVIGQEAPSSKHAGGKHAGSIHPESSAQPDGKTSLESSAQPDGKTSLEGIERSLSATFLFQGLSRGLLMRVLGYTKTKTFAAGDIIVKEGEQLDSLILVIEGELSVRRHGELIGQLATGEHTGATTLLHRRPSRSELRANGPVTIASFGIRSFWHLCKARPRLGVNLMERLVRRLSRELDDSIERRDDGNASTSLLFPYQSL